MSLRDKVQKLLHNLESQYKFKIIFAAETGSRATGLDTKESDIDVKGLFIYSEEQYLSVGKLTTYLKLNHDGKLDNLIDIDLELIDLRKLLKNRCKHTLQEESSMWLLSEDPYINSISISLMNELITQIPPPVYQIWSKISKYQQKFEKVKQQSQGNSLIVAKDVLNSIMQSFQILVIQRTNTLHSCIIDFAKNTLQLKNILKNNGEEELLREVEKMAELGDKLYSIKQLQGNKGLISLESPLLIDYFAFMHKTIMNIQVVERSEFKGYLKSSDELFFKFIEQK